MKKILFASVLLWGLTACQSKPVEPAPAPAPAPQAKPQPSPEEQAAEKARFERERAQAKKLAADGQVMPPIADIKLDVLEHNDRISLEDIGHSYEFVQAGFRSCYMRALAFDLEAKGNVTLETVGNPDRSPECSVKESDIQTEDFEACLKKACRNWQLPAGAKFQIKLTLSSKPAPLEEKYREMFEGHDGHDHGGHDHHH